MRITTPLTDTQIKNLKPLKGKNKVLYDGDGLQIEVSHRTGKKHWRFKYKSPDTGKDRKLSIGEYPLISLNIARMKRTEYRKMLIEGIDPGEVKHEEVKFTFKDAAEAYLDLHKLQWSDDHYSTQKKYLDKYLLPKLGSMPLDEIERIHITSIIVEIQNTLQRGSKDKYKIETGKRIFVIARSIFKHQAGLGAVKYNILADIEVKKIFKPNPGNKHAAPTKADKLKPILQAIRDNETGYKSTQMALKILPHVFLRNRTFRLTEWQHIDFDKGTWFIPANNLKLPKDKKEDSEYDMTIMMSRQVIEMLREQYQYTSADKYCFPSPYGKNRPLQESTLNDALKRLGFTPEEIVPHGFRAVFGTFFAANRGKHRLSSDLKEIALGHIRKDVYDRSDMVNDDFRKLYQWYSDFLDEVQQ